MADRGRLASAEHVRQWRDEGWVVVPGVVSAAEIDAVTQELWRLVPAPAEFFSRPPARDAADDDLGWPEGRPGFRRAQTRWEKTFPFRDAPGLNRLCVHPHITDLAARCLGTADLRLYQAGLDARYAGDADYRQPMHVDSNHSLLPAVPGPPWWHLETFLYLADVTAECAPTHLVRRSDLNRIGAPPAAQVSWPARAPDGGTGEQAGRAPGPMLLADADLRKAELPATGSKGSVLAYRSDVWHRAVSFTSPRATRFVLNLSFRQAAAEWMGYHGWQPTSTDPEWAGFAGTCTPAELALFGFPPPGHHIWSAALLDQTQDRYPDLDLSPWRAALAEPVT